MLEQVDLNKQNFSKIGKYISNKLHHIHVHKSSKNSAHPTPLSKPKERMQNQSASDLTKRAIVRQPSYQPCVGSYRVNYSVVDKNVHECNFSKSTPHFHRQVHKLNEVTPLLKDFPQDMSPRQRGLMQLDRMVGREQIKGSIRKNLQNPHQNRFEVHRFPNLTQRITAVHFHKMSARIDFLATHRKNSAEYDCHFEYNKKRLDSHIIPFQKQTSRPQLIFQNVAMNQSCGLRQEEVKQAVDKSVAWSKQLSRYAEGFLPSYMEKTITSRMAMQTINLNTLQMNCSDIRECAKIPRKRHGIKEKESYVEIDRAQ